MANQPDDSGMEAEARAPEAKRPRPERPPEPLDGGAEGLAGYSHAQASDSSENFDAFVARALRETAHFAAEAEQPDFEGFKFTGSLRPGRISPQMPVPEGCPGPLPDYALHPKGLPRSEFLRSRTKTIPVLQGDDLEKMRQVCQQGREVLDLASQMLRPGITGDEIDRVVYFACRERGLYPSPLNYMGFPKSLCVSVNEVICHGIPDSRPLEDGDIVNLDVSVCLDGFHADLNEMYLVGTCDDESHKLVRTAYNALKAATALIRPGTMYRQLGAAIEKEATENGCSIVTAFCGHGVGRLFHGPPDIPHFKKNKAVGIMKPGHVFTVEPMLNLGTSKERLWPDGWTAVTCDGKRSAQFEHSFLVTEDGFEVLTTRDANCRTQMPDYDAAFFQRG